MHFVGHLKTTWNTSSKCEGTIAMRYNLIYPVISEICACKCAFFAQCIAQPTNMHSSVCKLFVGNHWARGDLNCFF